MLKWIRKILKKKEVGIYTDSDVFMIVSKCFRLATGGWNSMEDKDEFFNKAFEFCQELKNKKE